MPFRTPILSPEGPQGPPGPVTYIQTAFAEQSANTSVGTIFADLLTLVLILTLGSKVNIHFDSSFQTLTGQRTAIFKLTIDGIDIRGTAQEASSVFPASVALTYQASGLAAGAHTFKIQWASSSGTILIRPTTTIEEHASLLIEEASV